MADVHRVNAKHTPAIVAPEDGVEEEHTLHDYIRKFCKDRGWIPLRGSMAHKTKRPPGEWDFIIIAPKGKVLLIECKRRKGKQSPEQRDISHQARGLGHDPQVVWSQKQFNEIVAPYL